MLDSEISRKMKFIHEQQRKLQASSSCIEEMLLAMTEKNQRVQASKQISVPRTLSVSQHAN